MPRVVKVYVCDHCDFETKCLDKMRMHVIRKVKLISSSEWKYWYTQEQRIVR